jgi:hypothetical protein
MAQYIPMTQVTVNAVVLNSSIVSCVLTKTKESQDVTTQADTVRKYVGGLESITIDMEVFLDQAAAAVTATLEALVGQTTTIVMQPMAGTVSATNRKYTVVGAYLESFSSIDGSLGSLASTSLQWTGGTLTITSV